MTTVLLGTTAAGMISTATCFASCFEQWKNLGSTSARFCLGHDLRQLDDAGQAQPPVPQRLHHLGEPGDEPGRHLPVVGRSPGQLQLPEQVVEEVGEARASGTRRPGRTPRGRRGSRRGRRARGGAGRRGGGRIRGPATRFVSFMERTVSREISPSPDARGCPRTRVPARKISNLARSSGKRAHEALAQRQGHSFGHRFTGGESHGNPVNRGLRARPIWPEVRGTDGGRARSPRWALYRLAGIAR